MTHDTILLLTSTEIIKPIPTANNRKLSSFINKL